jgi:hypothetical protein
MANYPDWVTAHKKKGTYVNFANGKYYLYAAHSERVKGTGKVRRVSDGYIGRITEEDGLIPARDKVAGGVEVFEYGLSMAALGLCAKIHAGFRRDFKANADFVMASSILDACFGAHGSDALAHSYLGVHFSGSRFPTAPTARQLCAIERGARMALDTLSRKFGADTGPAMKWLARVYMVRINGRDYLSKIPAPAAALAERHNIKWEG